MASTLLEGISLHPLLDDLSPSTTSKDSKLPSLPIILSCLCSQEPVQVALNHQILHNHACGCSKCWKPPSSLFSIVGVVPSSTLSVVANEEKLNIVDTNATILRYACQECGVHLYGRIEKEHAFRGLDFVHAEVVTTGQGEGKKGRVPVEFAAFVSSIIENGFEPNAVVEVGADLKEDKGGRMREVRRRLREILGERVYDCLSPGLMDVVGEWEGRRAGRLKSI